LKWKGSKEKGGGKQNKNKNKNKGKPTTASARVANKVEKSSNDIINSTTEETAWKRSPRPFLNESKNRKKDGN